MCGIAGVIIGKRTRSAKELDRIKNDFSNLLVAAQVRGTDAAGAFVVGDGHASFYKAPGPARDVTKHGGFWSLMDITSPDTTAIIGHTRQATHGDPDNNDNNHPLISGPIVGVHNGIVYNHDEIKIIHGTGDVPEVDSAAITIMLEDYTLDDPLKVSHLQAALPNLYGFSALALMDTRKPESVYLVNDGNPINMLGDSRGLMWFASTAEILWKGLPAVGTLHKRVYYMNPGTIIHATRDTLNLRTVKTWAIPRTNPTAEKWGHQLYGNWNYVDAESCSVGTGTTDTQPEFPFKDEWPKAPRADASDDEWTDWVGLLEERGLLDKGKDATGGTE